jgi:DNA-binding MarR family transcriptional regulator
MGDIVLFRHGSPVLDKILTICHSPVTMRESRTTEGAVATDVILTTFRANGLLLSAGDVLAGDEGLTSARWQVLGAVALAERPLTVPQIARRMGLTRQSVHATVKRLVDDGLVELAPNTDHRRSQLVQLTERGEASYSALDEAAGDVGEPARRRHRPRRPGDDRARPRRALPAAGDGRRRRDVNDFLAIAMLISAGLFAGGVVTIAWERLPAWRAAELTEFRTTFAHTLRRVDRLQPALLVVSLVSTVGFAIAADGGARLAAVVAGAAMLAVLAGSGAVLVPAQRRLVSKELPTAEAERLRTLWLRGHVARTVLAVAALGLVVVAAVV